MKKLFAFAALTAIVMTSFTSCKKDNGPKSKTELLTGQSWKQVKFEEKDAVADPWTDITNTYSACELDNIISFSTSGTFTETEGATKCSPGDPDIATSGGWNFQSNETILRLILGVFNSDATIETLDASTLRISYSDPTGPYYFRITMQH
ncbi:MAG: hypothetical protein ABIR30_06160 [Chitinophagaceae bacterium]